jgi:hypothetical protein
MLVKPEEGALKQIEIYKGMSGMGRLKIAFEMWETAFAQVKSSEKSMMAILAKKGSWRRSQALEC